MSSQNDLSTVWNGALSSLFNTDLQGFFKPHHCLVFNTRERLCLPEAVTNQFHTRI